MSLYNTILALSVFFLFCVSTYLCMSSFSINCTETFPSFVNETIPCRFYDLILATIEFYNQTCEIIKPCPVNYTNKKNISI